VVTVGELIEELQKLPRMIPVALSSDEEGNNVRLINGVGAQKVEKIEHQYMNVIHEDDLDEYDTWFLIAEVW